VDDLDRLRGMWRIRLFEQRIGELHATKDVVGSVHLGIGQEAIAVGACSELHLPDDAVFATYRGHGWALACGVEPTALFAELLGRESGVNGGRGGSAYFSAPRYGFYGENSIVGAHLPIAVGTAMANRWTGADRVCLAVCGDGAMNQGSVSEALNFAAVRDAPIVFIVENNVYSELTPIASMVRDDRLTERARPYGIPAERVDGNDVAAVAEAVRRAVDQCRDDGGPVLIEAMTERLVGHYIGDAEVYRPAGEVDSARERDPLLVTAAALRAHGVTDEALDRLEAEVRAEIGAACEEALAAPKADATTAREHVYA
jgi:TPP-dependent pyruvate/acetoin dehydrogenase alpha subunit